MRPLIYFTMVSVDGFIDTTEGSGDWVSMDEELHRYLNDLEREMGAYLYGRRMYELMQEAWPKAEAESKLAYEVEFAKIWKQIPKIVFSQTLERVEGNATLVPGDVVEEVRRLKEQPGADLEVGGARLAGTLMQAGLVDEFRIFVQPVILGAGTPMVPKLNEAMRLRLAESHRFRSGVVYLRYQRAG